jgi:HEPN domain-containing protein
VSDEVIGFHLQQAAEKLLKALLAAREVRYGRIHNLRALMDLLTDAGCPLPGRCRSGSRCGRPTWMTGTVTAG